MKVIKGGGVNGQKIRAKDLNFDVYYLNNEKDNKKNITQVLPQIS